MSTLDPKALERLNAAAFGLTRLFLDKDEIARLMVVALLAGENLVLIGPPGTAKSALIRTLAKSVNCAYYEYLMTRFTEPNEIFGPVDINAFREGEYRRRTAGMLPTAEIAFLDEVFKANSAILNALLTLLNERLYVHGNHRVEVPLLSLFGASNEVPEDEALGALYDRFLLRVYSDNLQSHHFTQLLDVGAALERGSAAKVSAQAGLDAASLRAMQKQMRASLTVSPDFAAAYKGLVFQLRNEGVPFSDRRAVKMLKLFHASALLRGASAPGIPDLALLRHVWSVPGQRVILDELVAPVIEAHAAENPSDADALGGPAIDLAAVAAEVAQIEQTLSAARALSDAQLFAHLKSLDDLRRLLTGRAEAEGLLARIEGMLDALFQSGVLDDV